jgi:hypothetical protein
MKKYIYTLLLLISLQVISASDPSQGSSYWSNLGSRASTALGSLSPKNLSWKQLSGIAVALGGAGYAMKHLYQRKQSQKERNSLVDVFLSTLNEHNLNDELVKNMVRNVIKFFAFNENEINSGYNRMPFPNATTIKIIVDIINNLLPAAAVSYQSTTGSRGGGGAVSSSRVAYRGR